MQIENDSAEIYVDWKNTLLWKPRLQKKEIVCFLKSILIQRKPVVSVIQPCSQAKFQLKIPCIRS
jgi:hypothetical protein